jgi:hypothetical protein
MSNEDDNHDTVIIWVSVIMGLILLITIFYIFVIRPGRISYFNKIFWK